MADDVYKFSAGWHHSAPAITFGST